MNERKTVVRLFWPWNDDKEERWLEQMARQGWHLASGPIFYTFDKGSPAEMRYRVDYPPRKRQGLDEYVRLCRDAGWERVFAYAGSQYFRTSLPDAPDIYTDTESRISKYKRVFVISLLLALATLPMNLPSLWVKHTGPYLDIVVREIFRWAVVLLIAYWVYLLMRLALHIRRLRKSKVLRDQAGAA